MESVESNNFYNLGTTLTTGHLAKLHLAVSQSLLAQELFWLSVESNNFYNLEITGTTFWWFCMESWNRWNHGIAGITRFFATLVGGYVALDAAILPPAPLYLRGGGDSGITGISGISDSSDSGDSGDSGDSSDSGWWDGFYFFSWVATCQGALVLGCMGQR